MRDAVGSALARAIEKGTLAGADPLPPIDATRPTSAEHGDLASSVALKLARPMRRPPLEIASAVAAELRSDPPSRVAFAAVDVAAPGFINVRLSERWVEDALDAARAAGAQWGRSTRAAAERVNVEFVSANPTGPLHIGNARGAFVGDLLARVLEAAGRDVVREYYFNDFGAQVRNLGLSVMAIRNGTPLPEDGYRGAYVHELARELPGDFATGDATGDAVGAWASERVRAGIEASMERLGVHFDVWKSEGSLHSEGWVDRAIERLRERGHLYEDGGALWFRSTALGDDKDRVVVRSDGRPTYFAADIGYLEEKFSRGFDRLVYIWGQDHHGTVARVQNAAEAMGYDRRAVEMLLVAWVRFIREGREISMSKRSGEFITLDELLSEVGVDAARWFFASRAPSTAIDFDIELAKRQSNDNPVYYVQYAHARISSILRKAAASGLTAAPSLTGTLEDPLGLALAKEALRLPELVEDAAAAEETQGLTAYATELATRFHAYYRDRRVVDPDDPGTSAARLALVEAVRMSLANCLALMGISAPESM